MYNTPIQALLWVTEFCVELCICNSSLHLISVQPYTDLALFCFSSVCGSQRPGVCPSNLCLCSASLPQQEERVASSSVLWKEPWHKVWVLHHPWVGGSSFRMGRKKSYKVIPEVLCCTSQFSWCKLTGSVCRSGLLCCSCGWNIFGFYEVMKGSFGNRDHLAK